MSFYGGKNHASYQVDIHMQRSDVNLVDRLLFSLCRFVKPLLSTDLKKSILELSIFQGFL
jgi:hypothetical protein